MVDWAPRAATIVMGDNKLPKGLKVMYMNTRSINGKLSDIIESVGKVDIFGANETWLNETMTDQEVLWEGMKLYRFDREADKAGGVLVYVRNELASYVTVVKNGCMINADIEMLTLKLEKPENRKKVIISIYRPPKGNVQRFVDHIDTFIDDINMVSHDIWVGGDYNVDFSDKEDNGTTLLNALAESKNMSILISDITRPGRNGARGTVIDNIITNAENIIYSAVYPLTLSDHYPVVGVQKKPREESTEEEFLGRSYKKYVKQDLEDILTYTDWKKFYREKNPNIQWEILLNIVVEYLDKTCPKKMMKITGANKSWLTTEIKELIVERRRLSEEYLWTVEGKGSSKVKTQL